MPQLQGTLDQHGVSQLFNLINLAKKTGTLTLFADASAADVSATPTCFDGIECAKLIFVEGEVVHTDVKNEQRDLLSLLCNSGALSDKQAATIRSRAESSELAQALLLIEGNYVRQSDIRQCLKQRTVEDIHTVLGWTEGSFLFENTPPNLEGFITVPVNVTEILVQYGLQLRETLRLREIIPSLDAVLEFTSDAEQRLQGVEISARTWRVLSVIGKGRTIRQIADLNGLNDKQIRQVVLELLNAGVVMLPVRPPEETASPAVPQEKESLFDSMVSSVQNKASRWLQRTNNGDGHVKTNGSLMPSQPSAKARQSQP